MDAVIATNLVCILFDPAIPTSSINSFNCFYTCIIMYIYIIIMYAPPSIVVLYLVQAIIIILLHFF